MQKLYNRLNRQDRRINEISQKLDNVGSVMTKFEARVEARIFTGIEEMKLFIVQLLKEGLSSVSLCNRNTPGFSPNQAKLKVWHWNANGLQCRQAILQQHIQPIGASLDVIMVLNKNVIIVQECTWKSSRNSRGIMFTPRLPAHALATSLWHRGVCTFVRKDITLIKLDHFLDCDTALELCAVEVVIGRKKLESVFLVNAYSNP
ncbi:hypothetical protein MRX96_033485 [Rhipicephalus microplus]